MKVEDIHNLKGEHIHKQLKLLKVVNKPLNL